MRRVLYNMQGLLSEKFILVEFPRSLVAGFFFCLKQLQEMSSHEDGFAFSSLIAPSTTSSNPTSPPAKYTTEDSFAFKCDVLQGRDHPETFSSLTLKPGLMITDGNRKEFIKILREETSLDDGQAAARCENLFRSLPFTQGPPGTGKTRPPSIKCF